MTGFICHDDYYDRLSRLTDEEVGHLFRQLMLYHAGRTEEMTDFIGIEGLAFDFMSADIDRMEEKCETNSKNGSKGGRPRKQTDANESEENQTKPTETEKNPTKPNESEEKQTKGNKDKDKDKDIDKEKNNKNTSPFFDRFWSAYPRHINKQGAMKAFAKAKIDGELLEVILKAIEQQKVSEQWTKDGGQFIPHPATWLNGRRWEDEVITALPKRAVNAQQYDQRDYDDEDTEALKRMLGQMRDGA